VRLDCRTLFPLLGVRVNKSTTCWAVERLGYTEKRSVGASERDEWLRAAWRTMISTLDGQRRLVFVDEMGTNASLAPLYTCSLRGRRAYAFALPSLTNRGPNTTLLTEHYGRGDGVVCGDARKQHHGDLRDLRRAGALARAWTQASRGDR
jgi:hypothetical protein